MIDAQTMSLKEIEKTGLNVLARELGPVGVVRFLQLFETGYGNYTEEREAWLKEQSVDDIVARIQKRRTASNRD
jgi:hypothetical protein